MTFEARELSRDLGEPVELFYFRFGTAANAYHAYTDGEEPITHAGVVYEPVPIQRGAVKASGTLDRQKIEIQMPKWLPLPERFRIWPPAYPVTFIIRQGHVGDSEFLAVAAGRVLSVGRAGAIAKLTCEPIQTAMRRTGLRENWQYGCPHVLYGNRCKASKADAKRTVTVMSVTTTMLRLAVGTIDGNIAERYVNGIIEWDGPECREQRMILHLNGPNQYFVSGSLMSLEPGDQVDMFYGCAHNMEHCRLHNNILNFGGDPFIPFKNPVGVNPHW